MSARMLESGLDCPLRDFVEGDPANASAVGVVFFGCFGLLLFLAAVAEFVGKMRSNGFAFAVRIGREIDGVGRKRQLLQLGEDLLLAGNDDVLRTETVFDIDTETALGQVFHVAERGVDSEILAQILLNCFRLSRRFDDD